MSRSPSSPILAWLRDPSPVRGIRFARDDGGWDFRSYVQLAAAARAAAAGLLRLGVAPGDTVCIQASLPETVASLFGAMTAGASPCILPSREAFQDGAQYEDGVAARLRAARPSALITGAARAEALDRSGAHDVPIVAFDDLVRDAPGDATPARPSGTALVQFTSGSSRQCRGVKIAWPALEANVKAIQAWLEWTERDPIATWLPLHHDMGLVGCLITPVVTQADITLFEPRQFVRRPARFLRCFGAEGAVLTAMPTFALDYIVRRVRGEALRGMHFGAWRGVIVGAELVKAETLRAFHDHLAPFGFARAALLPAYGLAEATLTVSGVPLRRGWREIAVDPASVAQGAPVAPPGDGGPTARLVGCGALVEGVSVEIHDEDGRPLPERHVGEIVVTRGALCSGYLGERDATDDAPTHTRLDQGTLCTGDMGMLADGELFILGRGGDALKIRGQLVFAEEIEASLSEEGIPSTRAAALLGWHRGAPTVAVLLEAPRPAWAELACSVVRRHAEGLSVDVRSLPLGAIARTTSGKPMRRALWRAFTAGAGMGDS